MKFVLASLLVLVCGSVVAQDGGRAALELMVSDIDKSVTTVHHGRMLLDKGSLLKGCISQYKSIYDVAVNTCALKALTNVNQGTKATLVNFGKCGLTYANNLMAVFINVLNCAIQAYKN